MFAKPLFTTLLLVAGLIAWIAASFGGSSKLLPFWPGALALGGVAMLSGLGIARGFHGKASVWCVVSAMLFIIWVVARAATSEVAYLARQDMVFGIAAFISYSLTAGHFETVNERRWVMVLLFLVLLVNVGWSLWQETGEDSMSAPQAAIAKIFPTLGEKLGWTDYKGPTLDLNEKAGMYMNGNHFAGMLEMTALPALAFFLLSRAGFLARGVALLVCSIGLWGTVLSTSRFGQVCMLGGMLFVLGLWWFARVRLGKLSLRTAMIVGAVAGGLLISGMVAGASMLIKSQHRNFVNSHEWTMRSHYGDRAWAQFLSQPIEGTGARSYEYEERGRRSLDLEEWNWYVEDDLDVIFTHNDWMQLLADYGGIGALLGVVLVAGHLINGLMFVWRRSQVLSAAKRSARQDDRLGVTVGALGGIVAIAVHSIGDFNMHIGFNTVLAGMLLGMLANPGRESLKKVMDEEGEALVPRNAIWVRVPLVALGVIGGGFLLLFGPNWLRADAAARLGERMVIADDYYEATKALDEAVRLDPANYTALINHGLINMTEGVRVRQYSRPKNAEDRLLMEKIHASFMKRACTHFESAYAQYERNPYISLNAGNCYSRLGEFDKAELWFSRAFKNGKACRELHFQYGQHLIRKALQSADPRTQIELAERALNEYFMPAYNKFRASGTEKPMIEQQIHEIKKLLTNLRISVGDIPATPP